MSRSLFAVFHPAATDDKGQAPNINADTAAGEVRGLRGRRTRRKQKS